jgi:hypothetical protein
MGEGSGSPDLATFNKLAIPAFRSTPGIRPNTDFSLSPGSEIFIVNYTFAITLDQRV